MELCREVIDGLQLLKTTEKMSAKQMDLILIECKNLLLKQQSDEQPLDPLMTIEEKVLKLSICTLIVELVKHNSGEEAMDSVLDDYGLKSSETNSFNTNCLKVIEFYRTVRHEVRDLLCGQTFGQSLPQIIDCQWNQFFVLKSESNDKINEIQYLIDFSCDRSVVIDGTGSDSASTDLVFSANLAQLQDLCHKLRECRKAVEKVIK